MTCQRFDKCYFPKLYNDLSYLFKEGWEEKSWIYHNCCINYTQEGCTLSKLEDIEFKCIEKEIKLKQRLQEKKE